MKTSRWFLLTSLVTTIASSAVAQTENSHEVSAQQTTTRFGFYPAGSTIPAKPHAPFSGVLVQQIEQTLNDGTHIAHDNQEVVARDGMGRVYRGHTIERPGREVPSRDQGEPRVIATITDPVAHVQYMCTPVRVCRKMEYRTPPNRRQSGFPFGMNRGVSIEELGSSSISGVEVQGKRMTWEIAEGAVGNDRPFTSTNEVWYSKELDLDVQIKRSDPRVGTRTTTITEIVQGEPDPKYFQVPAGYRVVEGPPTAGALSPLQTESEYSYPGGTIPAHQ